MTPPLNKDHYPETELDLFESVIDNMLQGGFSMLFKEIAPMLEQHMPPNELTKDTHEGNDLKRIAHRARMNRDNRESDQQPPSDIIDTKPENDMRIVPDRHTSAPLEAPSLLGMVQHILARHGTMEEIPTSSFSKEDNVGFPFRSSENQTNSGIISLFPILFPQTVDREEKNMQKIDIPSIYNRQTDDRRDENISSV
ncbi:hypothetical protein BDF14DRAFT_1762097, partial [Spinellus fusiger]